MIRGRVVLCSLGFLCTLCVISSNVVAQTPGRADGRTQSDPIVQIKDIIGQIAGLMTQLSPNLQAELAAEFSAPPGLAPRNAPVPKRGDVSPQEEEILRSIRALKGQIDGLMSRLPPIVQTELSQELRMMARQPSAPRPAGQAPSGFQTGRAPGTNQPPGLFQPGQPRGSQPPDPRGSVGGPDPGKQAPGQPAGTQTRPGERLPQPLPPPPQAPPPQQPPPQQAPPPQAPPLQQPPPQQEPPQQAPPTTTMPPPATAQANGPSALMLMGDLHQVKAVSVGTGVPTIITVEVEATRKIPRELAQWIQETFATNGAATRSGEVRIYSANLESAGVRTFQSAHISRVTFPVLDAANGKHGDLAVDFVPGSIAFASMDTQTGPALASTQKGAAGFSFTLSSQSGTSPPTIGLVKRIESLTWNSQGGAVPTLSNIELTLPMHPLQVFSEWSEFAIWQQMPGGGIRSRSMMADWKSGRATIPFWR